MGISVRANIGGLLLSILACGAVTAEEPELVLGGDINGSQNAPEAPRITLGSNLFVEPCSSCNYDSNAPSGFVLGPDNCLCLDRKGLRICFPSTNANTLKRRF